MFASRLSLSIRPSLTWFVLVLHHFPTPLVRSLTLWFLFFSSACVEGLQTDITDNESQFAVKKVCRTWVYLCTCACVCSVICSDSCLFLWSVIQGYREKILAYLPSSLRQLLVVEKSLKRNDRQKEQVVAERGLWVEEGLLILVLMLRSSLFTRKISGDKDTWNSD